MKENKHLTYTVNSILADIFTVLGIYLACGAEYAGWMSLGIAVGKIMLILKY